MPKYGNLNCLHLDINTEKDKFCIELVYQGFFIGLFHLIPIRGFPSDHRKVHRRIGFLDDKKVYL